ncbi:hypothetical protein QBC47DRAFT_359473 [Echria macrotheca]|uniref:Peptidase M3A/M3B catalytic domain-containing protein n=1 Tax=Echria macrotheca TaxID=438768 RepID=A0AAJ0BFE6_9PEZI|nr:hypothetical protein QBC47DRAFT_359473 [Echria macrotheca]
MSPHADTNATLSRTPPQSPVVFDATSSSLIAEARALIFTSKTVWDNIAAGAAADEATFDNTIRPIIDDENRSLTRSRLLRFYASTSPSKELREASYAATTLLSDFDAERLSRDDVFARVAAVVQSINDNPTLDDQSKYYAQKLHRAMCMNGCVITDSRNKDAFRQANKRVKELVRQCTENLEEDASGIWFTPEELEGLPQDHIDKLPKGDGEALGKLWLKTKPPTGGVLRYAHSEATRKRVYYAKYNRLPQNVPLFRELVLARDTVARLLGFPNYFAYQTSQKMAQTPEAVTTMLLDIKQRTSPIAVLGASELLRIKTEQQQMVHGGTGTELFFWDEDYYDRIRDEREIAIHQTDSSEYFELYSTLDALLSLFGRLFETRFERITSKQQLELGNSAGHAGPLVWHEDVMMYAAWDTRDSPDSFLGYAYFDLFPREGKYGHRGCYDIQYGYEQADGSRFHASVAFVMNYPKPTPSKPTLLGFTAARQMFHELGHLHQGLLARVRHAALQYIDRDFVEAPCIMFEQFFSNSAIVREISHHYSYLSPEYYAAWLSSSSGTHKEAASQPPIKLDEQATAQLVGDSRLKRRARIDRQTFNLFLSWFDVLVHSPTSHEELEKMDLAAAYNKLKTEMTGLRGGEVLGEGWAWSQGQSVFRMIVSGYDAGYYTYVLGRVYALDMWERGGFGAAFDQPEQMKDAAKRFRDEVLAVSGRQPEMTTLHRYLGGIPSTRPYFQWMAFRPEQSARGPLISSKGCCKGSVGSNSDPIEIQ